MKTWMLACSCIALTAAFAATRNQPARTIPQPKEETTAAIELFKRTDPKMGVLFTNATGYAIFPSVTKGAFGIGAAHGNGEVLERGRLIGSASLTQVTIGLQLGGQEYAEVIFFENLAALTKFTSNQFAMSAQASAVAASEGASRDAKYQQGVMVFTIAKGGLMFEASIGGQKFKFTPLPVPINPLAKP
jgi:lipid-binding SYLF domain-containing protein